MGRLVGLMLLLALVTGCAVPTGGRGLGQVAYIQGRDLWVRPLPAGKPRQLTRNGGYSSPRWSASGTWLTVRRGEAWLAVRVVDGAPVMLPGVTAAAWAPREDRLAYRDEQGNLGVLEVETRRRRVVARPGVGESLGEPFWSPDGAWLAYVVERTAAGRPHAAALWKVPSAGGGVPQEVYALRPKVPAPACLTLAGWTPNSADLLYWPSVPCSGSLMADGLPLMAVPADGGKPRELVPSMLTHPDFLAPSPATGYLAVAAGPGRMTWTLKQVEVVDPRTGQTRLVSPRDLAAISPAWAPGGHEVAFAAAPDTGPTLGEGEPTRRALMQRRIWVYNLTSNVAQQVTQDDSRYRYRDEAPVYAGGALGQILFARLDQEGQASLWLTWGEERGFVTDIDPPPGAWFGYYGWLDWSTVFAYHR